MSKGKKGSFHLEFDTKSLELIANEMVRSTEENPDKNKDTLIERIRQMTEFQIWGEKHNESFFEFFCEKNILEVMLNILKKSKSKDIIIQIIQSLSMYLTNIKKAININYILSNNSINEFITHNFDFNDEEIVDYYISFLKSLSLRMETIPLELFYNKKYKDFPLLSHAVRFYNSPGSMIRTSVHNITLTLFQMRDPKLENYLTSFPFVNYFINLSCYLKDYWLRIDEILPDASAKNCSKVQELLDDQYDLLMYIEDIFKLKKENISRILANALLSYAIIPMLLRPLGSNDRGPIGLNLQLYLLNLMFNSISYIPLQELIFLFLFAPNLTSNLLMLRQTNPETPPSYSRNWSFKTAWDTREDVLNQKYLELLDPDPSEHEPIEEDSAKLQPAKVTINVEEEFRSLARFVGVAAEPSNLEAIEFTKLAPLDLLEQFKKLYTSKGDLINNVLLEPNQIRNNFLSFLLSRDDNMIMLMCSIIHSAVDSASSQNSVPMKTFSICKIMFEKAPALGQVPSNLFSEGFQNRNETCCYILDCLYKLLNLDPPFRLVTMRLIAQLIIDLSESKNEQLMISEENLILFNAGYRSSIIKVLKFLQNSIVGDIFADLFETQWKDIYHQPYTKLKRKDYVYTLVPVTEEAPSTLDLNLRHPETECELAKREISIYLLFRKIRYTLIKISKYSAHFGESYRPASLKENLSTQWEEGKLYEIDQRKLHPCNLKEQGNKQPCFLVEDEENFLIVTQDPAKPQLGKVLINTKLKNAEILVDRLDPQSLTVTLSIKGKHHNKTLSFNDQNSCMNTKRMIDEKRKYQKHFEMTILLKNFENTKNDVYELPLFE